VRRTPADGRLAITVASCPYDPDQRDPEALLARSHPMTGWASALVDAGAGPVSVVQRFSRDAQVRLGGVDYHLVSDGGPGDPRPWFWGGRFVRRVLDLAPGVVHVDGLQYPMVVRHLRWRLPAGAPIVVQDHGGFGAGSSRFHSRRGRALYRFGLGAADGFLFTSRPQATPWLAAGIIPDARRVYEIPEASTDMASWPTGGAPRLPGQPALLWVGRLDANKDPLTVLDGFERADLPGAALTMVFGEDALLPQVRARIAGSTLRDRVHLRGRLDRRALAAVYAGADLFVLGSHHEVACFSLIEALSFGVTPVVTDIPPFRALTSGVGALFPPGDAAALARALATVARGDLVEGRRAVRAHFTAQLGWSAVGSKALAIYRAAGRLTTAST
jgi:glycosyltransferase involved in cell wall biosynthesis